MKSGRLLCLVMVFVLFAGCTADVSLTTPNAQPTNDLPAIASATTVLIENKTPVESPDQEMQTPTPEPTIVSTPF